MPRANPNISPAANRLLGATFDDPDDPGLVPRRFRTFQGFERFGPSSVQKQFSARSDRTPAQNAALEATFNQNLLEEKIRFVNPGLAPNLQKELVGLHNQLTALERSGQDRRGIARPLLDRIERVPDREGILPDPIRLDDATQNLGRGGQLGPTLPNIGGREGARIGSDIVSGTRLNRSGVNALIEFTQRGGPVVSRTGATVGEGRR